jgi:hypothetical protein
MPIKNVEKFENPHPCKKRKDGATVWTLGRTFGPIMGSKQTPKGLHVR